MNCVTLCELLFTFHKHLSEVFTTGFTNETGTCISEQMENQVNKVEYMDTTGSSKLLPNGTS